MEQNVVKLSNETLTEALEFLKNKFNITMEGKDMSKKLQRKKKSKDDDSERDYCSDSEEDFTKQVKHGISDEGWGRGSRSRTQEKDSQEMSDLEEEKRLERAMRGGGKPR